MICFCTWAESKLHKTFALFFFTLLNCSAGGALQVGRGSQAGGPGGGSVGPAPPNQEFSGFVRDTAGCDLLMGRHRPCQGL